MNILKYTMVTVGMAAIIANSLFDIISMSTGMAITIMWGIMILPARAFFITKWKVWAFDKVRNVHNLKRRAIDEKIIWEGNRLELWTAKDRKKWQLLQEKFKVEDVFIDDSTVPEQTLIYYSPSSLILSVPALFAAGYAGIMLIINGRKYIPAVGVVLLVFILCLLYLDIKRFIIKKPQLILSSRGIEANNIGFYSWNEIHNEHLDKSGGRPPSVYFLVYNYPDGHANINVNSLKINRDDLMDLINLYRQRYYQENGSIARY